MKQYSLLLILALIGLNVSAQHVTPIEQEVLPITLDSARILYAGDDAAYLSDLLHTEGLIQADAEMLKTASRQLKDEKAHAQDVDKCLAEAQKTLKQLEKIMAQQEATLSRMHTTIERQVRATMRYSALSRANRDAYEQMLNNERRHLDVMLRQLQDRKAHMQATMADLERAKEALNIFVLEISQKETDIKKYEQVHKMNSQTLKTEIKAVRTLIKSKN